MKSTMCVKLSYHPILGNIIHENAGVECESIKGNGGDVEALVLVQDPLDSAGRSRALQACQRNMRRVRSHLGLGSGRATNSRGFLFPLSMYHLPGDGLQRPGIG